jgi:hypothetical protein
MSKFEAGTHRWPMVLVATLGLVAMGLAGCSSTAAQSDSATTAPARTTTTIYTFEGHTVSSQAHIVCSSDAAGDLVDALAVKTTMTPVPGWSDGAYTCTYTYAGGAHLVLSVRDLASDAAAISAFDALAHTLGRTNQPINLGAGQAFLTPAGNAVVQKDSHVLVVDVSGVPATWLNPPQGRAQVATAVATTIMGCWTEG